MEKKTLIRFWSVIEKRGQVYHEVKSYKRKQDAVNLLHKLKSESLTDYQLVVSFKWIVPIE